MKVTIRKFDNGSIAIAMNGITVSHSGSNIVSEKIVEVVDSVAQDYFKNPDKYIVDFEKGEVHAKLDAA